MTSLNIPDDLKRLVSSAAQELGVNPHAFMVAAIWQATYAAEQRLNSIAHAHGARVAMLQDGLGYDSDDVRNYLRQRLKSGQTSSPTRKRWRE